MRDKTDLQLMALYLTERFCFDPRGRLVSEPPGHTLVPRFCFVCTHHGNLWRFRADLGPGAVRDLARYAGKEKPLAESHRFPERLPSFERVLSDEASRGEDPAGEKAAETQRWYQVLQLGPQAGPHTGAAGPGGAAAGLATRLQAVLGAEFRSCGGATLLELPAGDRLPSGVRLPVRDRLPIGDRLPIVAPIAAAALGELRLVARVFDFF